MQNNVYLTPQELELLKPKKINAGSDGTIYRIGNGQLYKIYHRSVPLENVVSPKSIIRNEEGVRIFRKEDFRVKKGFEGGNKDYVKLRAEDAIKLAQEKQKSVHLTTLPLAPIYVNRRFRGCVLRDYKWSTSIYNVKYLPLKIRLMIARQILMADKELLENYIYHFDLGFKEKNKSNILLNYFPKLQAVMIDNDGRSTIYAKQHIEEFYQFSVYSLNGILLEILFDYPLKEIVTPLNKLEGQILLEENQVPDIYIDSLINQTATLEELDSFVMKMLRK